MAGKVCDPEYPNLTCECHRKPICGFCWSHLVRGRCPRANSK